MEISLRLKTTAVLPEDGYPIVLKVSDKQDRAESAIGRAHPEHWHAKTQMITDGHPDYDILGPKIMDLKIRARRLLLTWNKSAKALLEELLKTNKSGITLSEFGRQWISQQRELQGVHKKKGNIAEANNIDGYVRSVENALAQFESFRPKSVPVSELDYDVLAGFRRERELAGNSKATIGLYLRTLRMLYNAACLAHKIPNEKPFEGIFKGLAVRSYESKKKSLDRDALQVLEDAEGLGVQLGRARDLFLLQFYFGGCDLIDIYYLKKVQIKKGRVRFSRGKTGSDIIDLKIHPKAQAILERWEGDGEYVFPWRKDIDYYNNFRNRNGKHLMKLQDKLNDDADAAKDKTRRVDVQPDGGHLAVKVARHTFQNLAKRAGLHEDLIREIVGHQRNDVDNYYKDKFPQDVRDAALFSVVEIKKE